MDAPGFPVSMDNGTKWEATMTLKSLAAIEITIMTSPPARNFLTLAMSMLKACATTRASQCLRCMPTLLSRSSQAHEASNLREP